MDESYLNCKFKNGQRIKLSTFSEGYRSYARCGSDRV